MVRRTLAIFVLLRAASVQAETQNSLGLLVTKDKRSNSDNATVQNASKFAEKLTLITKDKHSLRKNNALGHSILENVRNKILKNETIISKGPIRNHPKPSLVKGVSKQKILPVTISQQNVTTKTSKTIVKKFKAGNSVTISPITPAPSMSNNPSLAPSLSEVAKLSTNPTFIPTLLPTHTVSPIKEAAGGNSK